MTKFFLEISSRFKQKLIKVNFYEKLVKTNKKYITQVESDLIENSSLTLQIYARTRIFLKTVWNYFTQPKTKFV